MKTLLLPVLLCWYVASLAQIRDTLNVDEVRVKAYFTEQGIGKLPVSISVIDLPALQNQAPFSLVGALNSVAGVRMEERSPASYRLSVRGSLLRSPFGVRNIKVYLDDFSFTDASGNTYLNLLDAGSISGIELIKGPEGSIYGANTGGVLLLKPFQRPDSLLVGGTLSLASYGTFLQRFSFQQKKEKYQILLQQGLVKSEGYREHSRSERKYIHLMPVFTLSSQSQLKGLFVFSDLNYQTPGGLTQAQFDQDPRSARALAVSQQAAIFNKTVFSGLSHAYKISNHVRHVVALSASFTDFKNPFVTNFEWRNEKSAGLRTFLEWESRRIPSLSIQGGYEGQQTSIQVENFVNNAGMQGDAQRETQLQARLGLAFFHLSCSPLPHLRVESALSLNKFSYQYQPLFPGRLAEQTRQFKPQVMPRMAFSYSVLKGTVLRASLSRGFSTPTLEEVNPSGATVNTALQAESGWNREAGIRVQLFGSRLYWDVVYFNYRLQDAIVRGIGLNESDYYSNAGSTKQNGLETEFAWQMLTDRQHGFLRGIHFKNSSSFYRFRFARYLSGSSDYSGNKLTGVPGTTCVSSLESSFPYHLRLFVHYNYTSSLPLNDANSSFAQQYHLVATRFSWKSIYKRYPLSFFAGVDNLLNEKYSLGNDLNALGNRFFNPAATRNYYFGISFGY